MSISTTNMTLETWSVTKSGEAGLKEVLSATSKRCMASVAMVGQSDGVYVISDFDESAGTVILAKARGNETVTEPIDPADVDAVKETIKNVGGIVLRAGGTSYYLTRKAFFTMNEKVGITADTLALTADDKACAELLSLIFERKARTYNFVYTKGKSIRRLFAVGSDMFLPLGGDVIYKFIQTIASGDMGDYVVESVTADQEVTEINLTFPNVKSAKNGQTCEEVYNRTGFTPKVIIRTSDHGYSSFIVRAVWEKGSFQFLAAEKSRNHKQRHKDGAAAVTKLIKDMEKAIFPAFTKLLPRLDELGNVLVTMGGGSNSAYLDYVDNLFSAVKLAGAIGARRVKKFTELLVAETDFSMPLTACDVVLGIIDAAERVDGVEGSHLMDFKRAIGEIPYAKVKAMSLAKSA